MNWSDGDKLPQVHQILFLQFLCQIELIMVCTALHTLLMMTAEFMLSKRPVLKFTAALFFLLKLFSSHIYFMPNCFYRFVPLRLLIHSI